jgi:photosystem II stability/assembly factor-like uncharacterized protein
MTQIDEEAQPAETVAAPEYKEEQDWLDRSLAYLKPRPFIWGPAVVAIVVIAALLGRGYFTTQPIGTDPTVAGRPLSNPDQHLHSMTIDPAHPGTIYLGTHFGLFTSTNDGKNWPEKHGQYNSLMIVSVSASPLAPATVGLVGADPNFGRDYVYITHDGRTWSEASDPPGLTPDVQRYAIVPGASVKSWFVICVGKGLYQTNDDGQTWKLLRAPVSDQEVLRTLWQSPVNPQLLLLGGSLGLYRSADGGATWGQSSGVSGVHAIAVSPASPHDVYLAADDGVYHSSDDGQSFAHVSGMISNAPFTIMISSHQHANILYALDGNQIWRSSDGGVTWNQQSALETSFPSALLVAPDNDQHLYAGFYSPPDAVESLDGGKTWSVIAS